MTSRHIQDILTRVEELRAILVLGQRSMPFLGELFGFVEDIAPLLDEVDRSMRETTSKIPRASSQLKSVSEATEMATTEILDLIDATLTQLTEHERKLDGATEQLESLTNIDRDLITLLHSELGDEHAELVEKIDAMHDEMRTAQRGLAERLETERDSTNQVREKMNHIMIALQVQDITTQQLASVNHLIETMRDRMGTLIQRLNGDGDTPPATVPRSNLTAFDPNANYNPAGKHQAAADGAMAAFREEPDVNDMTAPEEPGGDGVAEEAASQDDIDDLFSADHRASQDEIDKLFGGG